MIFDIINNIRLICVKSVQIADSGHPGMPLGISDIFAIFWYYFFKINFLNINSINKDILIISNGHGILIKYVLLFYNNIYKIEDIKKFRTFNSITPAHPEINSIINASTGPLGQGIGIGIGYGLKNKIYKYKFNNKFEIFNNKIWIFNGDGCIMEGVGNESISFCGAYNINNIILFYDSNNISIDGIIDIYFNENIKMKFLSLNWNVIGPINGHCYISIFKSIFNAINSYYPTIIIFKTIIGFLSPCKSYNEKVHGNSFTKLEFKNILKNYYIKYLFKKKIYFDLKTKYLIYYKYYYKHKYFELIRIYNMILNKINYFKLYLKIFKKIINKSTRLISSFILKYLFILPEFIGGSADLTSSNLTKNNFINNIKKNDFKGRYIHYGIREFCMGCISYGLSCNKVGYSFCSTFLVFMNYMHSIIRNFCLSKINGIFIFTHDSFLIGEDGPSHQPIEHLKILRSTLRLYVFRPFNLIEVILSWLISLKFKKNASTIILSRQNFFNNNFCIINIKFLIKGGYYLVYSKKEDLLIISSGSDLEIIFLCYKFLKIYFRINIFSLYCEKLFNKQNKNYKKFTSKKILFIEYSNDDFLIKYKNNYIFILNINKFGKSANQKNLTLYYNLTKKNIIKICLYIIKLKL